MLDSSKRLNVQQDNELEDDLVFFFPNFILFTFIQWRFPFTSSNIFLPSRQH